jgi:hypothetical protein
MRRAENRRLCAHIENKRVFPNGGGLYSELCIRKWFIRAGVGSLWWINVDIVVVIHFCFSGEYGHEGKLICDQ